MRKRQKRAEAETEAERVENDKAENELELTNGDSRKKKNKKKKKNKDRNESDKEIIEAKEIPTVSIAVSGSIINNAQSLELATRLAGQIARAATIFRIDEVSILVFTDLTVVVFDNKSGYEKEDPTVTAYNNSDENESGSAFFGMLPPLDAPHHLRKHEWAPFREEPTFDVSYNNTVGVTLNEKVPNSGETLVDVGLSKNVAINQVLEPGIRVTVAMGTNRNLEADSPRQVVSLSKPREEAGMYWGYRVRYASNINSVFKDCPYKGGYDHLIGTSEHGLIISSSELSLPTFRHLLVAFGGLAGLEEGIEEDSNLKEQVISPLLPWVKMFVRKQFSYRFSIFKNQSTEHCKEFNIKSYQKSARYNGDSALDALSLLKTIFEILELVSWKVEDSRIFMFVA
ncbi:unnamed protein product [Dovyalis caffra]|uniref:Uncharacterized protein n=1 Tax=Dovyalis caffra TaxID=77055 RepID=A0AAV1QZA3_9ROSI|nr:unnamed protein product [Dovyalis caffra]